MSGYLAVGHGKRDDGRYDPGSVSGSVHEHNEAHRIGRVVSEALHRSGEPYILEEDAGGQHDPNYAGTIRAANANPSVAYVVEIHLDWSGAPEGGFGIYYPGSSKGKAIADAIRTRYQQSGLQVRSNYAKDLALLRGTNDPACIWESHKVHDAPHSEAEIIAIGEAIAAGVCDFVKAHLNPSISYVPRPPEAPPPPPPDCSQVEAERDQARQEAAAQQARADSAEAKLAQAKQKAGEIGAL